MDYLSVQEVLDAGITNMTPIRNGTKNDDGYDALQGVDWFIFNGVLASTIYVSGNSYFGFGANAENLQINRRDNASYFVYREEGTVLGFYKFLKIRWSGYSAYNNTSNSYKMEYDVILWDTGDISVHMVTIPTSNTNGTSTFTFSEVSADNPDVTFLWNEDTNRFDILYEAISLSSPFDRKYLIRSQGLVYTLDEDSSLSILEGVSISKATFQAYGFEEQPTWEQLQELVDPEILYWFDSEEIEPQLSCSMVATPYPQSIITNQIDMSHETILGIESVDVSGTGTLSIAISIDDKQTWMAWTGDQWVTLSDDFSGMSQEVLEAITVDQWNSLISEVDGIYLRVTLTDITQKISSIYIDFIN